MACYRVGWLLWQLRMSCCSCSCGPAVGRPALTRLRDMLYWKLVPCSQLDLVAEHIGMVQEERRPPGAP